jgi:hypothetical protein
MPMNKWAVNIVIVFLGFAGGFLCGQHFSFKEEPAPAERPSQPQYSQVSLQKTEIESESAQIVVKPKEKEKPVAPSQQSTGHAYSTYTDPSKIKQLVDNIQNAENDELRVLAQVGTAEVIQKIKAIAFDRNRDPHDRAKAVTASNWQSDPDELIKLLETEQDAFLLESIIAAIDETEISNDRREAANQTIFNTCAAASDEVLLKSAKTYFSDKVDELSQIIIAIYNNETASAASRWFIENMPWDENRAAFEMIITTMQDEETKKAISNAVKKMENEEAKEYFNSMISEAKN